MNIFGELSKKKITLGFQHMLAMFGATVLIPIIMGFSAPVALFMAGVGTLIFHFFTKSNIPIFLGSSGSFVGAIILVKETYGMQFAMGAIAVSGLVYLAAALIVIAVGYKRFIKIFPPIVVAPIIMIIGITLAPIAVGMAASNWIIAVVTMATVVAVGVFAKGFFKLTPIITGIAVGYIVSVFMGVVDFKPVLDAAWFAIPDFWFVTGSAAPAFGLAPLLIIVPIAIVTIMEHIGEVSANGNVVGKNWFEKIGLHRTLTGNGVSTFIAGLIGAPPSTTYGENTATLAITKEYNPQILRIAAVIAIILAFIGKFTAFINSIPTAVMGGISFILFGMLICIGIQQLIENHVDLTDMKNSTVVLVPLIIAISSLTAAPIIIKITESFTLSGLSLAAVTALVLNLIVNVLFSKKQKV